LVEFAVPVAGWRIDPVREGAHKFQPSLPWQPSTLAISAFLMELPIRLLIPKRTSEEPKPPTRLAPHRGLRG